MKRVTIRVKSEYQVYIGDDILDESLHPAISFCHTKRIIILTDQIASLKYLNNIITRFESYGFTILIHTISGLEAEKNLASVTSIIGFLGQNNVARGDLVVALGDGPVCSLAGFCCSIYLSCIDFIIIPTTLLSMIDTAIGGKNGINNCYAKNQLGTFYQPRAVLCDTALLKDLPDNEKKCGFAEVVKYAVLDNIDLFDILISAIETNNFTDLVAQCVRTKNHFITADEFNKNERMILDFGHTIGNALEQFSNYEMLHGQAVALGMVMITKASELHSLTKKGTASKIAEMLRHIGLSVRYDIPLQYLVNAIRFDKKIRNGSLNLILLRDICSPFIHKLDCKDANNIENFFRVIY